MARKITFVWDNKKYEVGMEAYNLNQIVLPDGILLKPSAWFESLPPQPDTLSVVPHLLAGETPEYIAETMKAAIAKEIDE